MKTGKLIANRLFVTGTDTGVGKTVFSLLLMQFLRTRGLKPFYIKPIQTGCRDPLDTDSDARLIYEHVRGLERKDPRDSVIYCFKTPKAPYFAARDEGKDIDLEFIKNFVRRKSASHSPVVLEGAGGLFVPVSKDILMIDLISKLDAKSILVARAGLGTINHTLLSLEALNTRGVEPAGIVFIDSGQTPTPEEMVRENIEAVERASGVRVAGVIGRIENLSEPQEECFKPFRILFGDYP